MSINKLVISNFKSFNNLDVDLADFNVFIGANVSGKTNFIQIFEVLRNIAHSGLNNEHWSKILETYR